MTEKEKTVPVHFVCIYFTLEIINNYKNRIYRCCYWHRHKMGFLRHDILFGYSIWIMLKKSNLDVQRSINTFRKNFKNTTYIYTYFFKNRSSFLFHYHARYPSVPLSSWVSNITDLRPWKQMLLTIKRNCKHVFSSAIPIFDNKWKDLEGLNRQDLWSRA